MRMLRALTLDAGLNGKGSSGYEDGIHLDFARGTYYVKAANNAPTNAALTSLFTFTGGNESMYMGPAGLLVQSVTNTPRIEYNSSGGCLGLLMEPARTNLCLQSQNIATTWGNDNSSETVDATTAPDGVPLSADLLVENGAGTRHGIFQGVTVVAGSTYTFSVFVKSKERTACMITIDDAATGLIGCKVYANLATGAVSGGVALTTGTYTGSTITALANGWYRVTLTGTPGGAITAARVIVHMCNPAGTETYTGDSASGMYVWGGQMELGSFASSYIPTTTVSVARTADRCIRTLSTEFSASAGTLVVQGDVANSVGATPAIVALHNNAGTGAEEMILYANAGARRWIVTDGGVAQGNVLAGSITDGASGKMAAVYTANDLDLAVNGVMSGVQDTSATLPTVTRMDLMRQDASAITLGHILRLDYWPERKSNTYLQQATF